MIETSTRPCYNKFTEKSRCPQGSTRFPLQTHNTLSARRTHNRYRNVTGHPGKGILFKQDHGSALLRHWKGGAAEMKKGVPVSPGVAVARAFCVDEVLARREAAQLDVAAVTAEVQRFDDAVVAAAAELDAIVERVAGQLGEEEAAIFRSHRLILRDPALVGKVKSTICNRQVDAGTALHDTLEEYTALFARIPDEYLQERMADIRDVIGRILAQLALRDRPLAPPWNEPVILVAPEILPSQALALMARPPARCKSPACPDKEPQGIQV